MPIRGEKPDHREIYLKNGTHAARSPTCTSVLYPLRIVLLPSLSSTAKAAALTSQSNIENLSIDIWKRLIEYTSTPLSLSPSPTLLSSPDFFFSANKITPIFPIIPAPSNKAMWSPLKTVEVLPFRPQKSFAYFIARICRIGLNCHAKNTRGLIIL